MKEKLKQLETLRETKGKEQEAIELANSLIAEATRENNHEVLAKLYWELHLIWQHRAMDALPHMMEYAVKAKDIIEANNIDRLKGLAYRFLGRAATYEGDYKHAKTYYETSLDNFSENARSVLELKGFLAESLLQVGDYEKGLELAKETYKEYFDSARGKKLREDDYYVWAVWMSGIAPRIVNALMKQEVDFDKEEMREWLQTSLDELENSADDYNFAIRIDELKYVLAKLD